MRNCLRHALSHLHCVQLSALVKHEIELYAACLSTVTDSDHKKHTDENKDEKLALYW